MSERRCTRCGHQPGYHAATFCNLVVGVPPGRLCDCPGWDAAREGLDVELRRLRFGAYDGECSHGFGPPSSTCPNTECEDRAIDNWIAALSTEPGS